MRYRKAAAVAMVAALALAGCGGAKLDAGDSFAGATGGTKGTVNIAINPWVGYEADAAVVGYLLANKLGYTVEKKELKEEISWQGFETGEVDVILENWGHDDLKKTYIQQKKTAVEVGPTGNKGVIPGTSRSGWPTNIPTSPITATSTNTPASSRPRSPRARGSCSTATRRTSPTTRRWSRTWGSTTRWCTPAARRR